MTINGEEQIDNSSEVSKKFSEQMYDLLHSPTEEQKNDPDWVKKALFYLRDLGAFHIIFNPNMKNNRDLALVVAESFPECIYAFSEEIRTDKEILFKAIEHGCLWIHIPEELRKDIEVIEAYDTYTSKWVEDRNYEKAVRP